jgi:flagellar hook-associated protein 2
MERHEFKIYSFYSKNLSNMRFCTSFVDMKKTTVSDETKATITADGTVTNGTQTLEVLQLPRQDI